MARAARLLLLALLLGPAVGVLVPQPAIAVAGHHVMIARFAYGPTSLTVRVGDTVTWTNHDQAQHDVVTSSGPVVFRSPLLGDGQSWTHTFAAEGTYAYFCSVHPDMRAQVVVLPADPPPAPQPPAPPRQTTTQPATTTVEPTTAAPSNESAVPAGQAPAPVHGQGQQAASAAVPDRLDPMLIVAGIVAGVAILCLLLIGARPET